MEQVETGMSKQEEYCIFCVNLEALQKWSAVLQHWSWVSHKAF